jgi:L-iditol 2-dehydrogenase
VKAAVLHANDDLRYEEYPKPILSSGEVLIKVKASGICGSDIPRVLSNGAHFYPIVLGHEFSGDVVAVSNDVKSAKVGDRASAAPLLPCHQCIDCQRGDYSLCRHYSFIGSRVQGSFAEFVKVPERNLIKFSNSVSYEQGAFFEPSTVGLHGLTRVAYRGGEDVAILGGGTIGLFTAQWARIFGAKRVFVFDVDNDRLALAKRLGADVTVNTQEPNFRQTVMDQTAGRGFAFIYETAGVDVTMKLAFDLAANKAGVCFIGTPTRDLVLPPKQLESMLRKEFTLTGSWMSYSPPFPGREWELTAHCFATGQLKFDDGLIFKRFPLAKTAEAFALYKNPRAVKGKVMVTLD